MIDRGGLPRNTRTLRSEIPISVESSRPLQEDKAMSAFGCPTDAERQAATTERKVGQEALADAIIRACGNDPRAAVLAMLNINSMLLVELYVLTGKRVRGRRH
jgi:hypothetical protein